MNRTRSRILWSAISVLVLAAAGMGALALWRIVPGASEPAAGSAFVAQEAYASTERPAATRFHCPMHPTYVSDTPGDCPICAMRLIPIAEEPAPSTPPERAVRYRSTMNPGETSDHPGLDSMGMEMVPVEDEAPSTAAVAGYAAVNLPAHKQQFIGVTTAPAGRRVLDSEVRTVGRVAYDETGLSWINTKVSGWIEVLHADRTGQQVAAGQPLVEIYSPQLVATQEEFLVARDNLQRLQRSGALSTAVEQAQALLNDARRRLLLWDVPEAQVEALESAGAITRRVRLLAPSAGYVVEKTALLGKSVMPGENLYRIADLSQVWVLAQVYEQDLSRIRVGQEAEVGLSHAPGRPIRGRVDYLYPFLDPVTRTVDVRIVVPNPDLTLRPEMFATVRFGAASGRPALVVPNEAILDTGDRRIVFVKRDEGTFEPRALTTGQRSREFTEVLEGVAEGEEVVTSGNFLIDSESRLKAALAGMGTGHKHGG